MADEPETTATSDEGVKPFAAVFREHRDGVVHDEAGEMLAEIVRACIETGKKGSMTVKVSVSPQSDGDYLEVAFDVEPKVPKHGAKASIFYATANGSLVRQNPNQMVMGIREVPRPAVPTSTPEVASS